jgi:hypothetical protein
LPDEVINLRVTAGGRDPRKRLAREFPSLRRTDRKAWARAGTRLAGRLVNELGVKKIVDEDRALRILLAYTTIALAPDGAVPRELLFRAPWDAAVKMFAKLFPSTVRPIGRIDCVHRQLKVLKREAAAGLRRGRRASGRRAGPEGRSLAVDPELIAVVSKVFGRRVKPAYVSRHLFYTKPGDYIWPHPDDPRLPITVLICIRHDLPPGDSKGSAFVGYLPNGKVKRYELPPGSALAVEPGIIHAREPVRRGERVALLSIGLR